MAPSELEQSSSDVSLPHSTKRLLILISDSRLIDTSTEVIKVQIAGKEKLLHKELLCFYSKYHNALLTASFQEGAADACVSEMGSAAGSLFVEWLYSGKMTLPIMDGEPSDYEPLLVELYVFADAVDCMALRRKIISDITSSQDTTRWLALEVPSMVEAFAKLPDSSPLCKFFAGS